MAIPRYVMCFSLSSSSYMWCNGDGHVKAEHVLTLTARSSKLNMTVQQKPRSHWNIYESCINKTENK
jgi:hypothetical protein